MPDTTAPAPPTTQENPVRRDILTRITPATARAFAAKAAEARRIRAAQPPPPAPHPQDFPLDERLGLVLEQIELTRKALNNGCEPKDRAQLVRALCGLLDRERILRGEPLPGSLKPLGKKVERPVFHDLRAAPSLENALRAGAVVTASVTVSEPGPAPVKDAQVTAVHTTTAPVSEGQPGNGG